MSDSCGQFPTYESIGVRPLINCMGSYTIISGSLILPEVRQAMATASKQYVHLEELMEAVGARIAGLMQAEWALVTNGCAAALCQVAAACVAGTDPEKMARLPDTTGMKDEVIRGGAGQIRDDRGQPARPLQRGADPGDQLGPGQSPHLAAGGAADIPYGGGMALKV